MKIAARHFRTIQMSFGMAAKYDEPEHAVKELAHAEERLARAKEWREKVYGWNGTRGNKQSATLSVAKAERLLSYANELNLWLADPSHKSELARNLDRITR